MSKNTDKTNKKKSWRSSLTASQRFTLRKCGLKIPADMEKKEALDMIIRLALDRLKS